MNVRTIPNPPTCDDLSYLRLMCVTHFLGTSEQPDLKWQSGESQFMPTAEIELGRISSCARQEKLTRWRHSPLVAVKLHNAVLGNGKKSRKIQTLWLINYCVSRQRHSFNKTCFWAQTMCGRWNRSLNLTLPVPDSYVGQLCMLAACVYEVKLEPDRWKGKPPT